MSKAAVAAIEWRAAERDGHNLVDRWAHRMREAAGAIVGPTVASVLPINEAQRLVDRATTQPAVGLLSQHAAADLVAAVAIGSARVAHSPARPTMSIAASSSIRNPSRGLAARTWPMSSSRSRADQHAASSRSVVLGSSSRSMLASRCLLPATAPVSMRHRRAPVGVCALGGRGECGAAHPRVGGHLGWAGLDMQKAASPGGRRPTR